MRVSSSREWRRLVESDEASGERRRTSFDMILKDVEQSGQAMIEPNVANHVKNHANVVLGLHDNHGFVVTPITHFWLCHYMMIQMIQIMMIQMMMMMMMMMALRQYVHVTRAANETYRIDPRCLFSPRAT